VSKRNMDKTKLLVAFLKGVWVWGLIAWLYVVSNVYLFPEYQFGPLSIYVPIPTDLAGVVAFAVSFAAFVLWAWLK
jgi:hypothetical protein